MKSAPDVTVAATSAAAQADPATTAAFKVAQSLPYAADQTDTPAADAVAAIQKSIAAAAGLGIVIKKGLSAGHLSAAEAIPFVLANRAVSSLIIGSLNAEHLRENLNLASS